MWFQSKEYLKWSRMHLLTRENRDHILSCLGIEDGFRVLDVGCGTGEFTRYIGLNPTCKYVGIDIEEEFIEAAEAEKSSNMEFIRGDALSLPFEDDSFDIVVSHTFFTCIDKPDAAMDEMRRVCRENGKIVSITASSFTKIPFSSGEYPENDWLHEYKALKGKLDRLFLPLANAAMKGVKPEDVPRFFARSHLKDVSVFQVGKFFSLSNATVSPTQRLEYLDAEFEAEKMRAKLLPDDERERYIEILDIRKKFLSTPENEIWEWSGGTNLLVTGINTKG